MFPLLFRNFSIILLMVLLSDVLIRYGIRRMGCVSSWLCSLSVPFPSKLFYWKLDSSTCFLGLLFIYVMINDECSFYFFCLSKYFFYFCDLNCFKNGFIGLCSFRLKSSLFCGCWEIFFVTCFLSFVSLFIYYTSLISHSDRVLLFIVSI